MDTADILSRAAAARAGTPPIGDAAYLAFVQALRKRTQEYWPSILDANAEDIEAARKRGLSPELLHRLRLTDTQLSSLGAAYDSIEQQLPRSAVLPHQGTGPAGMRVRKHLRPLGVILMIFEARAEIALRSAAMCGAAGNAVLLRGGREMAHTAVAAGRMLSAALADAGLPDGLVTILDCTDRAQLKELLRRNDAIDVIIPRGSPSLIEHCRTASRIPLIASSGGVNHLYVHHSADPHEAARIALDSKVFDPAACTALDMVLVDEQAAVGFLTAFGALLADGGEGVTVRLPEHLAEQAPAALAGRIDATPLSEYDDGREYLSRTLAVRPVAGPDAAVAHIDRYGSRHTEAVVAGDAAVREEFCRRVDAATIVVNGSLRHNDAPGMGLGAALAISTGRLHVRGPVTLDTLYTHSWVVEAPDPALRDADGPRAAEAAGSAPAARPYAHR